MGSALHLVAAPGRSRKLPRSEYGWQLLSAIAVLCMPGLGYDTYRVFETLAAGSMPVLEKSIGMDRSWHKLPVLQLDDFADVTPQVGTPPTN